LMGGESTGLPGQSLVPVLKGEHPAQRDVCIQWNGREGSLTASLPNVTQEDVNRVEDAPIRTVITQDGWKLCRCSRDKHQLFDLNADPYETGNLYYTGKHEQKITDLGKRIDEWQASVKDTVSA
jgi:hypothetical protein